MRFSAAITYTPPTVLAPVARQPEHVGDPVPAADSDLSALACDTLPADLDQRVRQSGEW